MPTASSLKTVLEIAMELEVGIFIILDFEKGSANAVVEHFP